MSSDPLSDSKSDKASSTPTATTAPSIIGPEPIACGSAYELPQSYTRDSTRAVVQTQKAQKPAQKPKETVAISKHRLEELLFLEEHLDAVVQTCAMERITKQIENSRLKRAAKKKAQAEAILRKMNTLFEDVANGNLAGVTAYIISGGSLAIFNNEGDSPLHISVRKHHAHILSYLLETDTSNINCINAAGDTPLHIACKESQPACVDLLLQAGADPNLQNDVQCTPMHYAVASLPCVQLLLKARADILLANEDGKLPSDQASCEVKAVLASYKSQMRIWKGWAREDVEDTDTIFTEHAAKYSYCPVCLKFVERAEGCMYMSHNCQSEGRTYHPRLFSTYLSSDEGGGKGIQWCSICNRIAKNNRHFLREGHDSPDPTLAPAGNTYEADCRMSSSGGGLLEKYTRFYELRKTAHELNVYVGDMSESNAIQQLAESMWNAPFLHKKPRIAPWNLPLSAFPARAEITCTTDVPSVVPVERPAADLHLLPELHTSGINSVSLDSHRRLIQFKHRMGNGIVNTHENQYISFTTLTTFLKTTIQDYKSGLDCESLGYCWNRKGGCTAPLYPEELWHVLMQVQSEDDELVLVCSEYEHLFQEKFRGMTVR